MIIHEVIHFHRFFHCFLKLPIFSLNIKYNKTKNFVILMAFTWENCSHRSIWISWIKTKPWKVNLGKFVYKSISCTKLWYKNIYIIQVLNWLAQVFNSFNFSIGRNISTYPYLEKKSKALKIPFSFNSVQNTSNLSLG